MRKILRGHVFNIRFLFTLCLGLTALSTTNAQVSGTFTINSGAPATGTNFQTFTAAVASLAGGVNGAVTFNVSGGPYNEQVIINAIAGTSATNTITFNGNGSIIKYLSTNSNQRAVIKLNGADYVTFDNLTVEPQASHGGQYGYGFHLLNDADNNTIKNCHLNLISDPDNYDDHAGIVINGNDGVCYDPGTSNCDNNLVQNNIIQGGSFGITLCSIPVSGAAVFMTGNRILNNTLSDVDFYGIQMFYNSDAVIDGNDISGGPDAIYDLTGMFLDYYNQSYTITNNRIHNFHLTPGSAAVGFLINSQSVAGKEGTLANNLIYDFQSNSIQYGINSYLSHAPTYSISYLNIYNNTISLDDQTVTGTSAYGIYFNDATTNVNVMNNIVSVSRNSTTQNIGILLFKPQTQYAAQRNVVYVPGASAPTAAVAGIGNASGAVTNYTTMAAWQKGSGFDNLSTDVNPVFTNITGLDFRPQAQSIDNMAAYVGINTDIAGAARSTTNPDPGCYEFISPACATTITPGAASVSDSVLCSGPKVTLTLAGNSAGGGQTYTWQTSTTATGTYTDITSPLGFPYFETVPGSTLYYRVALACGATTAYSTPVRVLVNTTLNSGTYTINSALPTGGINFNSFSDVSRALQCSFNGSLVFNVQPGSGPYNEQFILPAIATSPAKTITFNGNGATITYAPTSNKQMAVVKLDGADYITFDSLNVEVQGSSTFGVGMQLLNDADFNTIKRCTVNLSKTVTSLPYVGIAISSDATDPTAGVFNSNCDTNLIIGNTVIGGTVGIAIASNNFDTTRSWAVGNNIKKNILQDNAQFGIFVTGAAKSLIDSNDISQPTRTALVSFSGLKVFYDNYAVTFTKNKVHNLGENLKTNIAQFEGITCENLLAPLSPIVFSNNLLYTWRGSGIQYGINNINSNHVKFYHNTISLDDTTSGDPSLTRGFGTFGSKTRGVEVKDNNFVIRRGGNGEKHGFYTNLNDSSLVADYNNYYIHSYEGDNYIGYMTQNYATLSDWNKTHKDLSSVSIDPVFYDVVKGDYTPTKIPFENQGHPVGITTDIFNGARDAARPDIGAIEFTICRALSTPQVSVEDAETNIIKFSWLPVANTTGYRVSRDSLNWTIPSSGAMGLSHTVTGLKPTDEVSLWVKALGTRADCPEYLAPKIVGKALAGGVFVPNTFTPNGDGKNDFFRVYSNVTKSIHWMVFNQWGEKIFESNDIQGTWDGIYKGKPQPIGVYVYVVSGMLTDGTKVNQKGTFNLVR